MSNQRFDVIFRRQGALGTFCVAPAVKDRLTLPW